MVPGDFNGDGSLDLVAASMKAGLWFIERDAKDQWSASLIDAQSSGFEHSVYGADLDGDGALELYVAADDQRTLNAYVYTDGAFKKERLEVPIS